MADWFENAVIYQVPVALFQDTTGNGWGDLDGVRSRLEHVADLGADAVWLQPFYRTPYVDGGYDVIDHTDVSDRFGTIEQFQDLVRRAEELGIRLVLDLVIQHTSVQHPWFREACRDPSSRYRDYYIWTDEPDESVADPVFPTVEESVWAWQEQAGQYYRHNFYSHEADLNLANPDVRDEVERIMRFWLELGIWGFRVDAVPYLVMSAAEAEDGGDGLWLVEDMRRLVQEYRPDGVLMAESDVAPEQYADHFGDGDRFTTLLDFWLNNHLFLALARGEAEPVLRALDTQPDPPTGCTYAIWLRNHDELDLEKLSDAEREEAMAAFAPQPQMRAFGRGIRRRLAPMLQDPRQLKLSIFLLCALPGTPVLLYGDEIGMGDDLELPDRASVRTPMQWDGSPNAGFSTGSPTQLVRPVIDQGPFGYHDLNVAAQLEQDDSVLRTLQRLFRVRKERGPFHARTLTVVEVDAASVLCLRYDNGSGSSLLLANLSARRVDVTLPEGHRAPAQGGQWREEVADHGYDDPVTGERLHLHGFGYRWLVR